MFYFSTSDYKWDILLEISLELLLEYYNQNALLMENETCIHYQFHNNVNNMSQTQ